MALLDFSTFKGFLAYSSPSPSVAELSDVPVPIAQTTIPCHQIIAIVSKWPFLPPLLPGHIYPLPSYREINHQPIQKSELDYITAYKPPMTPYCLPSTD